MFQTSFETTQSDPIRYNTTILTGPPSLRLIEMQTNSLSQGSSSVFNFSSRPTSGESQSNQPGHCGLLMVASNLTVALQHRQQHTDRNQVVPHSSPSLPGGSDLRIPDPPPLSMAHVQMGVGGPALTHNKRGRPRAKDVVLGPKRPRGRPRLHPVQPLTADSMGGGKRHRGRPSKSNRSGVVIEFLSWPIVRLLI